MEGLIEHFSLFGGVDDGVELFLFDTPQEVLTTQFVENFTHFKESITPSYIVESPYKEVLKLTARGDGRLYSILKKSKFNESLGETIVQELVALGVLYVEHSRQAPLKVYKKQKIKKELRSFRIQPKLRFSSPFLRFWFAFVVPYEKELLQGESERFVENFLQHFERLYSLVYEQLCNAFLVEYLESNHSIVSSGSYWDHHSEFDILLMTGEGKMIVGECKYKERKVCKNELSKLKSKVVQSGLHVDTYVLFSKSGFSNELLTQQEENVLLFELQDLKKLLSI
jgi:hypothetical protein